MPTPRKIQEPRQIYFGWKQSVRADEVAWEDGEVIVGIAWTLLIVLAADRKDPIFGRNMPTAISNKLVEHWSLINLHVADAPYMLLRVVEGGYNVIDGWGNLPLLEIAYEVNDSSIVDREHHRITFDLSLEVDMLGISQ